MSNLMQRVRNLTTRPQSQAWDPFSMMQEMMRSPFFRASPFDDGTMSFMPDFDVKETRDGYVIKADLPGIREADIDVSVDGDMLRISGHREAETEQSGDTWHTCERSYGSFTRTLALPDIADGDKTRAELRDGVLTIQIPRRAGVTSKKIDVKHAAK